MRSRGVPMRYVACRFVSQITVQMLAVSVGFQIYEITENPLWLGLAGLVQFLPRIFFLFIAGQLADQRDRRKIVALSQTIIFVVSIMLALMTILGVLGKGQYYAPYISLALVFGYGSAFAIQAPSFASLLPNIVKKKDFASATAAVSSFQQTAIIIGPALAGFIYLAGAQAVYITITLCNLATIALVLSLKVRRKRKSEVSNIPESPLAGFRYIWKHKGILGALSLDMFAVLFSGVTALLPMFAGVLAEGICPESVALGLMRAAPAVGGVLMAAMLSRRPIQNHTGRIMFACVASYGVLTICFAFSGILYLSLTILIVMGAVDMVSVVIRSTYVQVTTPDEVRGRVSAVNFVFIGASNQLGEFESGTLAFFVGGVAAVAIGGALCIGVVAAWYIIFKDLRRLDVIK